MHTCSACRTANSDTATGCRVCGAALVGKKPGGVAGRRYLAETAGRLDALAAEHGDPALFPDEVLASFRAGERFRARAALAAAARRDPARAGRWRPFVDDLRLWLEPCDPPALVVGEVFGTGLYGRHQGREDGTCIATLYVVMFWLPVFPIRSYLARPHRRFVPLEWDILGAAPTPRRAELLPLLTIGGFIATIYAFGALVRV